MRMDPWRLPMTPNEKLFWILLVVILINVIV
jgi:hypothetical protein